MKLKARKIDTMRNIRAKAFVMYGCRESVEVKMLH